MLNRVAVLSSIGESDHLSFSFGISGRGIQPAPVLKRLFSMAEFNVINNYLFRVMWIESMECATTVDGKHDLFLSVLKDVIDKFFPWGYDFPSRFQLPTYLRTCLITKTVC